MKIALISPYDLDRPGGVQNHVRDLSVHLVARGHTVETFGPGVAGGLGASVAVRVNGSQAPISLSRSGVQKLHAALDRFDPDVVHVHEPGVPLIGWAAARRTGTAATVATCHAYSELARYLPLLAPIGRRIAKHIDRFIAVSAAAQQFHSRALNVDIDRFTVIGNGIDLSAFVAAPPRPDADVARAPQLVFVGRLEQRKGVDVLIDAFLRLSDTLPNATLVIVGDGPQQARLAGAVPPDKAGQVRFVGRVSDRERADWLAWADIAVAPAKGGESFGIVLLEALASGCALVASDIPGYASVARNNIDAWLVPPNDAKRLTDTLIQVATDANARRQRSQNGHARAHTFAWPHIAAEIENVYHQAVSAKQGNG